MNNSIEVSNHYIKKECGIAPFPYKPYIPDEGDFNDPKSQIYVGMDSGVSNCSFSSIQIIRDDETLATTDFQYNGTHYFSDEIKDIYIFKEKIICLCWKYYSLFGALPVSKLSFEVLPINNIRDNDVLRGVLQAQQTTDAISMMAYILHHQLKCLPPNTVKYCLTGTGKATKEDMCRAAYGLTGDMALLGNDHMADAFGMCFCTFIETLKSDAASHNTPIPQKFMDMVPWNFKDMV